MSRQSLMSTLLGNESRDPFRDLTNEFERMMSRMRTMPSFGTPIDRGERALSPRTDISESDDAVRIELDLPGVAADDIDVQLLDQALTIAGSRHTDSERDENDYHIVERFRGEFRRRVPLGFDVSDEAVHADFADGVLTIVVDKPPESRSTPKKIEVNGKPAIGSKTAKAEAAETTERRTEPA